MNAVCVMLCRRLNINVYYTQSIIFRLGDKENYLHHPQTMADFFTLRLVAEAISAMIGCRVAATESEELDAPTLSLDLFHKYCLLKAGDNGEIVEKPSFEEYIQQTDEARQGGNETRQDDSETRQNDNEPWQNGNETRQSGNETRQDDNETVQGGSESKQGGNETRQSGSESRDGRQGVEEIVYRRPFVIALLLLSIYLLLFHNYIFMFICLIAFIYYFFIRQDGERVQGVQDNPDTIQIFFNFSGNSQSIFVSPNSTVLELRQKIQAKLSIDKPISLSFSSKLLDDRNTLESYNIKRSSTIQVSYKLLGGGSPVGYYVISSSFLKPQFDYDYTSGYDNGQHRRGNERYHLPIGWKKIALNVDRYGDSKWLGLDSNSWPVSYHGTNNDAASHIAVGGYDLSKGRRFAYGYGVYSSPLYTFAEGYSVRFNFDNHTYEVMLQNRVNPADLKKAANDQIWVTTKEENIRPYSLCIKQIN
ncbi:hypothetical protein RclHR1_00110022 [Rhizophagus clarus]|uniref:Ubiquitin-like domain-containing protein n=1 Tax=Rhizophagus clarus TaxID=94130 RepID=A0A2Z6QF89_9GLOM|nr:hypothetical protein RclHR1_00110022 [Rhizophagus clarus]